MIFTEVKSPNLFDFKNRAVKTRTGRSREERENDAVKETAGRPPVFFRKIRFVTPENQPAKYEM